MTSPEAKNPIEFSPTEREDVLQILEVCTDALAVYQSTLKQPTTRDATNTFTEIGISETSILQSLTGDAAAEMTDSRKEAVREKLRRDSRYVGEIIRNLKREINERGTIKVLIKEIEKIIVQEEEERVLSEKKEKMKAAVVELRKAIADEKMSSEKEKEHLMKKLIWTRDKKEKLQLIKNVEMRYVRAWEKARREQNVLRYELEINEMEKTLNDYHVHERNEKRVNTELMHYLTQRITVSANLLPSELIENRMEEWRRRYDREKKMYEKEIRKVRNEIEDARMDLEKLTIEYRSNQEFIDTYFAEQEALRKQKEHEDHVHDSAIRMQAWWRGVMVRRKLGPYRPDEKKKKRLVKTKK